MAFNAATCSCAIEVHFGRPMATVAFVALARTSLGIVPDHMWKTSAVYKPLAFPEWIALEKLLRAYASHPAQEGAIVGWVRAEVPA